VKTIARLARHWNSAFSRGVGYERTPPGTHLGLEGVDGYYLDFREKTVSPSAADPAALVPAGVAQLALGHWERALEQEDGAAERFLATCARLRDTAAVESDALVWRYPMPLPKYRLDRGWVSALAQAQAASAFVRAHVRTGDQQWADAALAAIRPLVDETSPSVLARLPAGPVPEECPSDPPSAILNGWIYAIWGLRDVAVGLGSTAAARMLDATVACLVEILPRYDTGWWSRYSLYPSRLPDLAKPFYHRLHVDQLAVMSRLTGESRFMRTAERWRAYDVPSRRVAAIAQKTAFVAAGTR
jgi:heparosan-N-sulfate-glucuronate 5-epimerase